MAVLKNRHAEHCWSKVHPVMDIKIFSKASTDACDVVLTGLKGNPLMLGVSRLIDVFP